MSFHRDGYDPEDFEALPCALCGCLPAVAYLDRNLCGLVCMGCGIPAAHPARTWKTEYERWNEGTRWFVEHNPEQIGSHVSDDEMRLRLEKTYKGVQQ
ncbi:MAG: hypothetical protein L0I10_10270 [Bifidobacterium crudilactis]|jgi:hypothetical protein|nr:hypothetical protein [Bifidobacterium crudilactis]MDN6468249.1 hypothetical protein [Bifidobacterium crudilactis]